MATRSAARAPRTVTAAALRGWPLPQPGEEGGKEDRGRVLVVGGSRSVPGAVLLAGTAALRAGAGKLQLATADEAAVAMAIALPEAKVVGLRTDRNGHVAGAGAEALGCAARADAVLVGAGMDPVAATRRVARAVAAAAAAPVVLDAGALQRPVLRALHRHARPGSLVLTPHHGEMAALLDCDIEAIAAAPGDIARAFAREWGVVVALKGAVTFIAGPDGSSWVNRAGSVGLGTSGSGDVLAGLIAGLAARGATPLQAAVWGVHLHAQAGARLARRIGRLGFLAREIADEVPSLLQGMRR